MKYTALIAFILSIVIIFLTSSAAVKAVSDSGMPSLDDEPLHQLPATSGKISWFSSRDVTGYCDGAAWGEKLGEDCGSDEATKFWYVAMRWPYVNGATESEKLKAKTWWHNKKILVANPNNGKQIVLAVKDWGPNEKTGRVIDVSNTALTYLGAVTDDVVNIEFAYQDSLLGFPMNDVSSSEDSRTVKAITWAESKIGTTEYYHDGYSWCLEFVEDAYKFGANSDPKRNWNDAKGAAEGLNAKNNKGLPPPGSFVFYNSEPYGHVGLSIGGGKVIHVPGSKPIRKDDYLNVMGLTYIGWAYPPVIPPLTTKPSWEFNTPSDIEGWEPHNVEGDKYSVENGALFIDPAESDPWIEKNGLSIDSSSANSIKINMSSNCPDNTGAIYFTSDESPVYSNDKKVGFNVITGQGWRNYTVLMAVNPFWKGIITGIRIDPSIRCKSNTNEDTVGFDYIRVESSNIISTQALYPYPNTITVGDELTFVYNIANPYANDVPIKVRLGAQIRTSDPKGEWIDDMLNDKIDVLKTGTNDYSRLFKTTSGLKPGYYDAHWVVMDEGTKQWIDHKELSRILIVNSDDVSSITPPIQINETEVNEFIKIATLTLKETISKFINLLKDLF